MANRGGHYQLLSGRLKGKGNPFGKSRGAPIPPTKVIPDKKKERKRKWCRKKGEPHE